MSLVKALYVAATVAYFVAVAHAAPKPDGDDGGSGLLGLGILGIL